MAYITATNGMVFEIDDENLDKEVLCGKTVGELEWHYKKTRLGITLVAKEKATRRSLLSALFDINLQKHVVKFRDGNERNLQSVNICTYVRGSKIRLHEVSSVKTPWCPYGVKRIITSILGRRGGICIMCTKKTDEYYIRCLDHAAKRLWPGWEVEMEEKNG